MKILHLIDSGGMYGAEKVLLSLCSETVRLGHDICVLSAHSNNEGPKAVDSHLESLGIKVLSWPLRGPADFAGYRRIAEWCALERFDVLHAHGYRFDIVLALFGRSLDAARIATVHGYTTGPLLSKITVYNLADKIAHLFLTRIVCVSAATAAKLLRKGASVSVIRNGVDVDTVPMRPFDERPAGAPTRLIAIGRLSHEKAFDVLISALGHAALRDRLLTLDIYGDGPERERLELLVRNNAFENVRLVGFRAEAASQISSYDLLVMPSLTEGMPVTLLEAMSAGVKIVATQVGGIPEMLSRYPASVTCEPGSVSRLAETIAHALEKLPAASERDVQQARLASSASNMARHYCDLYAAALT